MYRKPEGGEERTGLCESIAYSCFPTKSWDFREDHIRLFNYKATERCGRGACSDKGSVKKQRKISNLAPFFFLCNSQRRQQKNVLGVSTTPKRTWFLVQFVVKIINLLAKQHHRNQNT